MEFGIPFSTLLDTDISGFPNEYTKGVGDLFRFLACKKLRALETSSRSGHSNGVIKTAPIKGRLKYMAFHCVSFFHPQNQWSYIYFTLLITIFFLGLGPPCIFPLFQKLWERFLIFVGLPTRVVSQEYELASLVDHRGAEQKPWGLPG